MHQFGIKSKFNRRMPRIRHRINIRGGNDRHNILPIRGKVQMQLAAHQLADVDLGRDAALAERDMHGAHAPGDTAALDACGGELYQRDDDKEETVRKRLEVYNAQTLPLIEYYRKQGIIADIDGNQPMEAVTEAIMKAIGR